MKAGTMRSRLATMAWAMCIAACSVMPAWAGSGVHFRSLPFPNEGWRHFAPDPFTTAGLVEGPDHMLYGVSQPQGGPGRGSVFRLTREGEIQTVHAFAGGDQGQGPGGPLVLGRDGYLYGFASSGDAARHCMLFYRVSTSGEYTVLAHLPERACKATAPIIQAQDGNFYTTGWRASFAENSNVFRMTPEGVYTSLYTFASRSAIRGVIQASDGNLYGVADALAGADAGIVFRIDAAGHLSPLYTFTTQFECAYPNRVIQARDGALYGTCGGGGSDLSGVLYRLTLDGQYTMLLDVPSGGLLGNSPDIGFTQASDGYLYSAMNVGRYRKGTIFRMSLDGGTELVHSFTVKDGVQVNGELVEAADGRLYGTTPYEGELRTGTAFGFGPVTSLGSPGPATR